MDPSNSMRHIVFSSIKRCNVDKWMDRIFWVSSEFSSIKGADRRSRTHCNLLLLSIVSSFDSRRLFHLQLEDIQMGEQNVQVRGPHLFVKA